MSMKIITTTAGKKLYQHTILVESDTHLLLEELHGQRKRKNLCTFSSTINFTIAEYIRLWSEIEKEKGN